MLEGLQLAESPGARIVVGDELQAVGDLRVVVPVDTRAHRGDVAEVPIVETLPACGFERTECEGPEPAFLARRRVPSELLIRPLKCARDGCGVGGLGERVDLAQVMPFDACTI